MKISLLTFALLFTFNLSATTYNSVFDMPDGTHLYECSHVEGTQVTGGLRRIEEMSVSAKVTIRDGGHYAQGKYIQTQFNGGNINFKLEGLSERSINNSIVSAKGNLRDSFYDRISLISKNNGTFDGIFISPATLKARGHFYQHTHGGASSSSSGQTSRVQMNCEHTFLGKI